MLTEVISEFAIHVLDTTGYAGAAFLMGLESMVFPVPSEAVMPFVGFLVADGKWGLLQAILATSLGSFLGSYLSYLMGYYGGRPFVLSVGKYLLRDVHDLEMTERFFHRRGGALTLFICRFIPVVGRLVAISQDIGPPGSVTLGLQARFWPFALADTIGTTMWNSFLLYYGFKLRENWSREPKQHPDLPPPFRRAHRGPAGGQHRLVRVVQAQAQAGHAGRVAEAYTQEAPGTPIGCAGGFWLSKSSASGRGSRPGRSRGPAPAR